MRLRKLGKRKYKKQRKIIVVSLIAFLFIMVGGYAAFQTNLNITAKGNIVDRSRVIQSWTETSNEDFHTDYYKENIVSATFLDDARVPNNAVESWDVSESKDKGVMAWVVQNSEDNTKYDLYIGANGGVIANKDSSSLFFNFVGLKSIEFAENFDTSNVVNMSAMFFNMHSLVNLDVSRFNTSKVIDMSRMFQNFYAMSSLDLSNFDTKNVEDMQFMFCGSTGLTYLDIHSFNTSKVTNMTFMFHDTSLTNLDLRNFNTLNVTNMQNMFSDNDSLTTVNLCSFNTSNVTNMGWMFTHTTNLENVFSGENWVTTNATTTSMFASSGVSSVTTGQC